MNSLSPDSPIDNSSEDLISIYGLIDPENEEVFYIGKSIHPENRLQQHLSDHSNSRKVHRIQGLITRGLMPKMLIIERVPRFQGEMREMYWMNHYQEQGHLLTNVVNNDNIIERTHPIRPYSKQSLSTKFYRKTYYASIQCDQDIAVIRGRYGLSTESDAIRFALRILADAEYEVVLSKGARAEKKAKAHQRRLFN